MLEPSPKAELVAMRDLPKIVDEAVAAANKRLKLPADKAPFTKKWEIIGRKMRNLGDAEKFSEAVAANIPGSKPATLIIDKIIWCGFIERPNIPVERNF